MPQSPPEHTPEEIASATYRCLNTPDGKILMEDMALACDPDTAKDYTHERLMYEAAQREMYRIYLAIQRGDYEP